MNKDNVLLAEAYQKVNENIANSLITKGFNTILDIIQKKFPDLYNKLVAVNSPEELKSLLTTQHESLNEGVVDTIKDIINKLNTAADTPAAVTALGTFLLGSSTAASSVVDTTTSAGTMGAIGAGIVAGGLMALYGVIKSRTGWSKPLNEPKTGNELMAGVEANRATRGPTPKI
jgi:DNA-directed RNA polymerase subunit F